MPDKRALECGYAERLQMLLEHLGKSEAAIGGAGGAAVYALAEHDHGNAAEHARKRELRKHAVNAVLGLVDILQETERDIDIGQIRRSDQRDETTQTTITSVTTTSNTNVGKSREHKRR